MEEVKWVSFGAGVGSGHRAQDRVEGRKEGNIQVQLVPFLFTAPTLDDGRNKMRFVVGTDVFLPRFLLCLQTDGIGLVKCDVGFGRFGLPSLKSH